MPPRLEVVQHDVAESVEFFRPNAPGGTGAASLVKGVTWYHTIELPNGVVTPGVYDHRPVVPHYGLPTVMAGMRALDVATADGFWAFELERRGADVVALDVPNLSSFDFPPEMRDGLLSAGYDRPTGDGFRVAHQALGSQVERREMSIYDAGPEELGTFDLVHAGDLLLHLERPIAALRRIRSLVHGSALIVDCFDPDLPAGVVGYRGGWQAVTWWLPSIDTLAQWVLDAGFTTVTCVAVYMIPHGGDATGPWRAVLAATP